MKKALLIERWLESYVAALSEKEYSYHQIIQWSKNRGYRISEKGVYNNILNIKGKRRLSESKNKNMTTKLHPKTFRMQVIINKVLPIESFRINF